MAEDAEERMEVASSVGHQAIAFLAPLAPSENAKTRQATNYGIRLFREHSARHGYPNIHDLPERDIARLLKGFYGAVRTKDGQRFSVNSLIAIRYAISRYFKSGQMRRKIDIVKDPVFDEANDAFRTIVRELDRDAGRIMPCQKDIVDADDRRKLRYYFEHAINTPRGLLQKVWYDLMLHLGRRGRDGQRMLRKESFRIVLDRDGRRYVYLNEEEDGGGIEIIMEKNGDPLCPVRTFAMYLSRLNPACEALFQRPKDRISKQDVFWYVNSPIGKNMLATMMSTISKCAGLSRVYTNLRVRATAYGGSNGAFPGSGGGGAHAGSAGNPSSLVTPSCSSMDNGDSDVHDLDDGETSDSRTHEPPTLSNFLQLQNCQISRIDEAGLSVESSGLNALTSKLVSALNGNSKCENLSLGGSSLSPSSKNNQSMQDLSSGSKSCLQCGTAATLQFSSQGISQVFCSVSCFQTFTSRKKNSTSENGLDLGAHLSGGGGGLGGNPKCATCSREIKSHGGFMVSADKVGKKQFCSTVCLAHWVSREQSNGGGAGASSHHMPPQAIPITPFTGHCDYCLSKRPLKRQVVGTNGVIHHFCSDECMMCYQTLLMNGLVPGQTPPNSGGGSSNANNDNNVIGSVMSLAAVSRRFGMNLGEMAQNSNRHLSVYNGGPNGPVLKRDQSIACRPIMVSVAVSCKPASFRLKPLNLHNNNNNNNNNNHNNNNNSSSGSNNCTAGTLDLSLSTSEPQNLALLTEKDNLTNGTTTTSECSLDELSTASVSAGFETLYSSDLKDGKEQQTSASPMVIEEIEDDCDADDEDDGGDLNMEAEVCMVEGPPLNGNTVPYWDYSVANGTGDPQMIISDLNSNSTGHKVSDLPVQFPTVPAHHNSLGASTQGNGSANNGSSSTNTSNGPLMPYDFCQRRLGRTTKRFSWEEIAERSKSQTMWAVKLFRDWLVSNFHPPDFEHLQPDDLASELKEFYGGLVKPDGEDYSVSTLNSVRASINRYLTLPPYSKPFSIIFSREFRKANESFFSRVRSIQQLSMSTTFTSEDMQKLLSAEALSHTHPNGLLRKVWFCLVLVLGGKHGTIFPLLTKDCFKVVTDPEGQRILYFHFAPAFLPNGSEIRVKVRQTASTLCPVSAIATYLTKLSPQCEAFFQTPNHPLVSQAGEVWFLPRPLPDARLKGMMKEISSAAGLSRIYSNQALQAMAAGPATHPAESGRRCSDLLQVAGLANAIVEQ